MNFIDHIFAVVPMLGILIFVHELGHFLVAKACGVRVLKFSIGFGAPIGFGNHRMRWVRSGTEYVVGWIPLGGFVRMLGEYLPGEDGASSPIPDDVRDDEFLESKPVWQKLSIVFAGPAMNLVLPIVCLVGILWVGLPRQDAVIGMVEPNSPAALAGVRAGDRVVSLEGEPVAWWDDVATAIRERAPGDTVLLEVDRAGERESLEVPIASHTALDRFGTIAETGWIGLGHRRFSALVGVPSESSLAAASGLRSGDVVIEVAGTPVEDWEALRATYREASAAAQQEGLQTIRWKVERAVEGAAVAESTPAPVDAKAVAVPSIEIPEPVTEEIELETAAKGSLEALGLVPAPILVQWVQEGMPAARAGLQSNDLILTVDGDPVGSFQSFASIIQTSEGRELTLTYSRNGRVATTQLAAEETTVPGPYEIEGMEQKVYRVGISNALSSLPGSTATDRVRNPIVAVPRSIEMSYRMTVDFLEGLGKLVTGDVGTAQLSGPIGIARIARRSLDRGWLEYVFMMMLISINLGILNLLPIPILDGGQAVIYSIEGIKRSPVSLRTREIASQMGFALLVLLMGRAFWNDLTPFWTQFVGWLSERP